jgi:hypothetical protein
VRLTRIAGAAYYDEPLLSLFVVASRIRFGGSVGASGDAGAAGGQRVSPAATSNGLEAQARNHFREEARERGPARDRPLAALNGRESADYFVTFVTRR